MNVRERENRMEEKKDAYLRVLSMENERIWGIKKEIQKKVIKIMMYLPRGGISSEVHKCIRKPIVDLIECQLTIGRIHYCLSY